MKVSIFVVGAACLTLGACASPNAGNPNGAAYFGAPGSTYDVAANPPRANGTVTYNPAAPLPPVLPPADANKRIGHVAADVRQALRNPRADIFQLDAGNSPLDGGVAWPCGKVWHAWPLGPALDLLMLRCSIIHMTGP